MLFWENVLFGEGREKAWCDTKVFCGGAVGIGDHLASVLVSLTGQQPDGELIDIAARKGPTTFPDTTCLVIMASCKVKIQK